MTIDLTCLQIAGEPHDCDCAHCWLEEEPTTRPSIVAFQYDGYRYVGSAYFFVRDDHATPAVTGIDRSWMEDYREIELPTLTPFWAAAMTLDGLDLDPTVLFRRRYLAAIAESGYHLAPLDRTTARTDTAAATLRRIVAIVTPEGERIGWLCGSRVQDIAPDEAWTSYPEYVAERAL